MPSRRDVLCALASVGLAGLAGCTDDQPVSGRWPRSGYDDCNTSDRTDVDGPGSELTMSWSADVPYGPYRSTPVLADGQVLVGHDGGSSRQSPAEVGFEVFDAGTGETVRSVTATTYDGDSGAIWYRDSLVVEGDAAYLVAFDGVHSYTVNGEERWHRPIDGSANMYPHQSGHPVVVDGFVYAPTAGFTGRTDTSEGLLAIDDATGEVEWRYEVPGEGDLGFTFAPAYHDDLVFLTMHSAGVVALDAATGDLEWSTRLQVHGPSTVADGGVFVAGQVGDGGRSDGYESFVAGLDARTGEEVWREVGSPQRFGREIAVASGRVYCREPEGALVCRDAETGAERWRYADESHSTSRPVVTDDAMYHGGRSDDHAGIVAIDPEDGTELGFVAAEHAAGPEFRVAATGDWVFASHGGGPVFGFEACSLDVGGHCLY